MNTQRDAMWYINVLVIIRAVPLFASGMELRQKCHQEWLSAALKDRIDETGFHAMVFLREGLRFAWLKLEGVSNGRFNRIKEGAASK